MHKKSPNPKQKKKRSLLTAINRALLIHAERNWGKHTYSTHWYCVQQVRICHENKPSPSVSFLTQTLQHIEFQQWSNSDQPLEEKQPNTPFTSITASILREVLKSLTLASHKKEKALISTFLRRIHPVGRWFLLSAKILFGRPSKWILKLVYVFLG